MTGTRDRNLPANLKLRAPGVAYDQEEMRQAFRLIEQHYHLQLIPGSTEAATDLATVLIQLANGNRAIVDAMYSTAIITFPYEIVGYRLIEDCGVAGDIILKVEYATNSDFPTFTDISGTDRPTLSSSREDEDTAIASWTNTTGDAYSQLRATAVGDAVVLTKVVLAIALRKL